MQQRHDSLAGWQVEQTLLNRGGIVVLMAAHMYMMAHWLLSTCHHLSCQVQEVLVDTQELQSSSNATKK